MNVPLTFEQALDNVLSDIREMLIRKRHDYGKHNISKFGLTGVMVRASDKVERLITLSQRQERKVENETTVDTWMDLAGYAVIALLLVYKWFELNDERDNNNG